MWQGHLTLKNESAAVQLHFLSGNVQLAKSSLPGSGEGQSPALRIAQRMRLEQTQLEGVQRRMQVRRCMHCVYHSKAPGLNFCKNHEIFQPIIARLFPS